MSDIHTKYCVKCGAKAQSWCGHVLKKNEKIIAGWCEEHMIGDGFVGHYRKWMGTYDSEKEPQP